MFLLTISTYLFQLLCYCPLFLHFWWCSYKLEHWNHRSLKVTSLWKTITLAKVNCKELEWEVEQLVALCEGVGSSYNYVPTKSKCLLLMKRNGCLWREIRCFHTLCWMSLMLLTEIQDKGAATSWPPQCVFACVSHVKPGEFCSQEPQRSRNLMIANKRNYGLSDLASVMANVILKEICLQKKGQK